MPTSPFPGFGNVFQHDLVRWLIRAQGKIAAFLRLGDAVHVRQHLRFSRVCSDSSGSLALSAFPLHLYPLSGTQCHALHGGRFGGTRRAVKVAEKLKRQRTSIAISRLAHCTR